MTAIPKKKWLAQPEPEYKLPEADLQRQADDYLAIKRLRFFRIPDFFWRWINFNAPAHIQAALKKYWRGLPDNNVFISISEKYSLCLHLELKSAKGQLHGKQKEFAREYPVQISRNPEDTMKIVDDFIIVAEKLKGLLI